MQKIESRFAACHPAVSFGFFIAAIVGCMFFQHPAYLLASMLGAVCLLLTEKGSRAVPMLLGMIPLFLILTAVNPLFNHYGKRVLFTIFGRPYTLEALLYGMVIAGMLVGALLWFSCYSAVMTTDKFTWLFGNLIPALSLILVMVLRLIPAYRRKAAQISGARHCIGKSPGATDHWKEKTVYGIATLSALTTWALEGAIVTADSMRSRGYGTAKRTSFQTYSLCTGEAGMAALGLVLFGVTLWGAALGWTKASFTPVLEITSITGIRALGFFAYALCLLIPTLVNLREELKWKFLRSRT